MVSRRDELFFDRLLGLRADYVGLAIAAAMFALPLFFWLSERSKRELEDKKDIGFIDSK